MMHVDIQPEPANFEELVHEPGRRFLLRNPNPAAKHWKIHSYWRRVLCDLHNSYRGICAYSCHWIPYDTGAKTVEHFLPKDTHPDRAYEWSNYRLVCATLNGRKGTSEEILDPFQIDNGWFIIEFPSLLVKPAPGLNEEIVRRIKLTIDRLGLNEESTCLKSREKYIRDYCQGKITFDHIQDEAPFIALELERQGFVTSIKVMMDYEQTSL